MTVVHLHCCICSVTGDVNGPDVRGLDHDGLWILWTCPDCGTDHTTPQPDDQAADIAARLTAGGITVYRDPGLVPAEWRRFLPDWTPDEMRSFTIGLECDRLAAIAGTRIGGAA